MALGIAVLYNTDFEHIAGAASADAVAVRTAAEAVRDALIAAGHRAELVGMWGKDVPEVMARLDRERPDLVFNLCESLGFHIRWIVRATAMSGRIANPG